MKKLVDIKILYLFTTGFNIGKTWLTGFDTNRSFVAKDHLSRPRRNDFQ